MGSQLAPCSAQWFHRIWKQRPQDSRPTLFIYLFFTAHFREASALVSSLLSPTRILYPFFQFLLIVEFRHGSFWASLKVTGRLKHPGSSGHGHSLAESSQRYSFLFVTYGSQPLTQAQRPPGARVGFSSHSTDLRMDRTLKPVGNSCPCCPSGSELSSLFGRAFLLSPRV